MDNVAQFLKKYARQTCYDVAVNSRLLTNWGSIDVSVYLLIWWLLVLLSIFSKLVASFCQVVLLFRPCLGRPTAVSMKHRSHARSPLQKLSGLTSTATECYKLRKR